MESFAKLDLFYNQVLERTNGKDALLHENLSIVFYSWLSLQHEKILLKNSADLFLFIAEC